MVLIGGNVVTRGSHFIDPDWGVCVEMVMPGEVIYARKMDSSNIWTLSLLLALWQCYPTHPYYLLVPNTTTRGRDRPGIKNAQHQPIEGVPEALRLMFNPSSLNDPGLVMFKDAW